LEEAAEGRVMDNYRIIISPEAYSDLDKIHRYISNDSENNAAELISQILDAIDALAIVPHHNVAANMPRNVLRPVRTLPVKSYVIYFDVFDEDRVVRIIHIRHGARRPPTQNP
jgi:toxin ParE1/3/4